MTVHKFAGKVVYPVLAAILLFFLLRPFCMEQGKCDYRLLVLLMGIPFGIGKMLVWIVPGRTDLGGTLGFLVFQILLGGIIGSLIMLWKLAEAAVYLIWGIYAGILWVYGIKNQEWRNEDGMDNGTVIPGRNHAQRNVLSKEAGIQRYHAPVG